MGCTASAPAAVLQYGELSVVDRSPTNGVEAELCASWITMAGGADRALTPQQLRRVFEQLGRQLSDEEFDEAFRRIDVDGNGTVEFDEFVTFYRSSSSEEQRHIRALRAEVDVEPVTAMNELEQWTPIHQEQQQLGEIDKEAGEDMQHEPPALPAVEAMEAAAADRASEQLLSRSRSGSGRICAAPEMEGGTIEPATRGEMGRELIEQANSGDPDGVRRLLAANADVNVTNASGASALHRAAYQNHLAVVEVLVAAGANLELKDHSFGSTPLHAAAVGAATSSVDCLVKSGADWRSENKAGRTPLALAEEQANVDVIALLSKVEREDAERRSKHNKLCQAMMVAVKQAHTDKVSRLLQEGADANWEPRVRRRAALIEAAERNHVAVMEVLVAGKAEVDRKDVTGSTALMVAANYGSAAATQFLLREGADDSLTDDFGRTALSIAKDHKKIDVVRTLQQWAAGGIDRDSPMPMGRGPVPLGRTHQRWASQARDLPAGFMIEDGRLPSDVGPPIRSEAGGGETTEGAHVQKQYRDVLGRADASHNGPRTATLSERSSLDHAYAPTHWDAGGIGGLIVTTALELCDTESETTHSRETHSREAERSRGSVSFNLEPLALEEGT